MFNSGLFIMARSYSSKGTVMGFINKLCHIQNLLNSKY